MMEVYGAYADYRDGRALIERMFRAAAEAATGGTAVRCGEHDIDFGRPFRSTSMVALVEEATGVDFLAIPDAARARDAARSLQVPIGGQDNWGQVVEAVFGGKGEHTLVRPTPLTDSTRENPPTPTAHRKHP